ncbi:MAG: discoidin domain-containing protein [Fuerstiella sp.]
MKSAVQCFCCVLTFSAACEASLIPAVSVSSQGSFTNSASLLTDGFFPAEGTVWTASTNVHWSGQPGAGGVAFTFDYGSVMNIEDIRYSFDNNDRYHVHHSTDGVSFLPLSSIVEGDGEVGGGMDTGTGIAGDPEYIANMDFSPVAARYLKIFASGGDGLYALAEFQAFGTAVPEPAYSMAALMLIGSLFGARHRRQRDRKNSGTVA